MTYETVLENLKKARKQKQVSFRELSEKMGISETYLSNMESGKNALNVEKLLKICDVLGIEPASLFGSGEQEADEYAALTAYLKRLSERDRRIVKSIVYVMLAINANV